MRNGNPLVGLRIDNNEQRGMENQNGHRIHINIQRAGNNIENNINNEENPNEEGNQIQENLNNRNDEMDLI